MEKPRTETFDPDEMLRFGFDPTSEADRQEWERTTPPAGTQATSYDYRDDQIAYGAPKSSGESGQIEQS